MRYFNFFLFILTLENASGIDWSGRYLSISGKNALNIEIVDHETSLLSLEVLGTKDSKIKASLVASFEKDFAISQSLGDKSSDCILKLQKNQTGIFISDFCSGDNLTGYYQASSDFLLESMNILPQ